MSSNITTYLILGANGFVGRHVVDELAKDSEVKIKALDRYNKPPQFNGSENIEIVKADIFNESDIAAALSDVDVLVHCFSATTPYTSDINPHLDMTDNVINSIKIFEMCVDLEIQKIVFVSSGGAVYGTTNEIGEVDELSVPRPVSPYGIGKLTIEHYLDYFKRKSGMEYTVFRLTNPYGPGQQLNHNQGVIPAFIDCFKKRQDVTIYGDGTMSRDYVFIRDAASMMVQSIKTRCKHNTYNIGSGKQTSLLEIVDALQNIFGEKIGIEHKDTPKTFLKKTPVSIKRYEDEFGPHSLTKLRSGLIETIDSLEI